MLGNVIFGQKDYILVKGIARGLEELESRLYDSDDEELDLDNDPDFEVVDSGRGFTVYEPKSEVTPDNGGENRMPRKHNDPDDLGRKARDTRGSQQDMFDELGDTLEHVNDRLEEQRELTEEEFRGAVRYLEHQFGQYLEDVEDTYDAVADFTGLFEDVVDDHYDSLEEFVTEFRNDDDYSQLVTEMGTMRRNTERFRDEYGL